MSHREHNNRQEVKNENRMTTGNLDGTCPITCHTYGQIKKGGTMKTANAIRTFMKPTASQRWPKNRPLVS